MLLQLLSSDPAAFLIIAVCLVMSLTLHEWGHAYAADRLGDRTPRMYGRVTLNPAKHLDPIGTLLLLFAGFGFAKPVPVNFTRLGRWGGLLVAAAGPLMNIIIALVCLVLLKVAMETGVLTSTVARVLITLLGINVILAVFNLMPIPLLDGSRIVAALFPRTLGRSLAEFEMLPYSFLIVLLFIFVAREPIFGFVQNIQRFVLGFL